jgi:hypothetical protein
VTSLLLMFVGVALGLALLLSMCFWACEKMFGRRVGVYLGYSTVLAVAAMAAYSAYAELTLCTFGAAAPFPECEWSSLLVIFTGCLMLVTVPSLILSMLMLKKWSDTRHERVA